MTEKIDRAVEIRICTYNKVLQDYNATVIARITSSAPAPVSSPNRIRSDLNYSPPLDTYLVIVVVERSPN